MLILLIPLSLLIFFELIADVFSKKWSLTGHHIFWILALLGYVVANIFWLKAIRAGSGLARGALIFSVGSAIAALAIGILFYKESLTKLEFIGIVLGLMSLIFILWK